MLPRPASAWRILSSASTSEFVASVRLRLAGGARAGGLVWQYQDEHNFYAAMLDLTRQELSMYRVTGGNRVRLETEDDLELDPEAWHTLKVARDDGRIYVALGGIRVFEERDERGGHGIGGDAARAHFRRQRGDVVR